jgi:hypothetical protein
MEEGREGYSKEMRLSPSRAVAVYKAQCNGCRTADLVLLFGSVDMQDAIPLQTTNQSHNFCILYTNASVDTNGAIVFWPSCTARHFWLPQSRGGTEKRAVHAESSNLRSCSCCCLPAHPL